MGSEIVTVCLDGVDGSDYADAVDAALALYDESSDDPRWVSSWRIAGGDDGLPLLNDQAGGGRVLLVDGLCAGGPRGLLDLDGAWTAAAAAAGRLWDTWWDFAGAYPKARSLEDFYAESAADPLRYDTERASADYVAQPVVRAAPFFSDGGVRTSEPPSLERDPVGWFGLARDDYAARRAAQLLPTAGLLTREREWIDPDRTPPLGGSSAARMLERFRNRQAYFARADAYLRALPADCFVVRVKVRI